MTLTTAFLFLFITIVIPGFIFQRIYFYGDFSKQFSTKENVSKLLLTSLIPGLIISFLFLPCYNYFSWDDVKFDKILTLFEKLSKSKVNEDNKTLKVFSNYNAFLIYCLWECLIAAILGFTLSRLIVRGLKLDRKWKTLRYKNQWYYVFSGEVFEFIKFKNAVKNLSKENIKGKEILLAKADVLIKGAEGSELYTGYVADYDLNPLDISKLQNLYLLDAIRYKTIKLKNDDLKELEPSTVEKKQIPGKLFVLNLENMININVSYLLAPLKEKIPGQVKYWLSKTIEIFVFIILFPLALFIFWNPDWIDFLELSKFKWYIKLPLLSFYINFTSLLIPSFEEEQKVYYYKKKDILICIGFLILFLLYYFIIKNYIQ